VRYQNIRSASPSVSFVTIHAWDRQTDRRTERQTELREQYGALHCMQSHDNKPAVVTGHQWSVNADDVIGDVRV